MCEKYSTSKGDYYYMCYDKDATTYTEWQAPNGPKFSPQPTDDYHAVPLPGTLALMVPVLVAAMLWRKK
jgi:hypothetical protein